MTQQVWPDLLGTETGADLVARLNERHGALDTGQLGATLPGGAPRGMPVVLDDGGTMKLVLSNGDGTHTEVAITDVLAGAQDAATARQRLGLGALATLAQIGLTHLASSVYATQAQAEAGSGSGLMTATTTGQAIAANAGLQLIGIDHHYPWQGNRTAMLNGTSETWYLEIYGSGGSTKDIDRSPTGSVWYKVQELNDNDIGFGFTANGGFWLPPGWLWRVEDTPGLTVHKVRFGGA